MNIVSHMFLGVILLKILNLVNPIGFPFTSNYILIAMIFSILPDLDVLWNKKKIDDHHETPFHTTLFWMTIAFILLMINFFLEGTMIFIVILFILTILGHLFFDFIFGRFSGVPIFEPFCSRKYVLFSPYNYSTNISPTKISKKKYKEWAKMYFENRYLIALETIIWIVAILLLVIR